jgi:hypothetical protein
MAAFARAGAGGGGLLVDGIAAAGGLRGHRPRIGLRAKAGQRPGCAQRVGNAQPHGQAQIGAILCHLSDQFRLTAKKMRAAGEVDDQRIGRFCGDPGREFPGPAVECAQKGRLAVRMGGTGEQARAHGMGIAQRLSGIETGLRRAQRQRRQDLRRAALRHGGKGGFGQMRFGPDQPFGPEAGKPE